MPTASGGGSESRRCTRCGQVETRALIRSVGVSGLVLEQTDDGTGYRVRCYKGAGGALVIPSAAGGLPVTEINGRAFMDSAITSVQIPASVTAIGANAFYDCFKLTSVTFAKDSLLADLGSCAFYGCSALKTITLPKNLTTVPHMAFAVCQNLTSVYFEAGSRLTTVGSDAFYYCRGLKNIALPETVTAIGGAFEGCESLESFTIPASVTSISGDTFSYCKRLKSLHIPTSVTSIYGSAFKGMSALTSLTVDGANTRYKSDGNCIIETDSDTLIAGCNSSVIPDYVLHIGDNAFYGSGVSQIALPQSLVSIGGYAFYNTAHLKEMDIHASVATVGYWAFGGWNGSQTVNVYGAEDEYAGMVKLGTNWKAGCSAQINYYAEV
jgi:hypothetical protein